MLREKIKNYFQYKNPSNYNYLPRELDSMNFKIIYTKKPDYTMMLITFYHSLISINNTIEKFKIVEDNIYRFKYSKCIENYY